MLLRVLVPFFLWAVALFPVADADEAGTVADTQESGPRTIAAVRISSSPPKIDGYLSDDVWGYAPATGGFIQRKPDEGKASSESTTVQVCYDDEALYVGIAAFDGDPGGIVSRLVRRDQWTEADRLMVCIDSYHDHQTAYWFGIKAGGSLDDGYYYDDDSEDGTWDGVWDARCATGSDGWTAEFRIPHSVLRFSAKEEYTWGIDVGRYISRKKEEDLWVMVPSKEKGWISRFGHLTGIRGISPPSYLEILPYTLGRSAFLPSDRAHPRGRDSSGGMGADIRYGIASNVSLSATVNPDFGQVEADPAVLNLSVFETFYGERRPFFLEGAQTFQTPFQLFYSRRIGRKPGYFSIPPGYEIIKRPESTTILGAVKLTGKTSRGTSFGMLDALAAPEYAVVETSLSDLAGRPGRRERLDYLIEPLTNSLVVRLQQDLSGGSSTAGVLATAVNRRGAESACTGGGDWNLKWGGNAYQFSGQVAASRAGRQDRRRDGYAARGQIGKTDGWAKGEFSLRAFSPGFNPNDLGFIQRTGVVNSSAWLGFKRDGPYLFFRQSEWNFNNWSSWNYDGARLQNQFNFNTWHELANYWWVGGEVTRSFEVEDDLDTRGGPRIINPAGWYVGCYAESDGRSAVRGDIWCDVWFDEGGGRGRGAYPFIALRPTSRLEVQFRPGLGRSHSNAQWVTNVDDEGDGISDHFVYGAMDSRTMDFTARANMIFTRDLTLELFAQSFVTVGDYKDLKELSRPHSYDFKPYHGTVVNPDFNRRSFQSNIVFRFEYRPGSTLYLVWTQSRSASLPGTEFRPFRSIRESLSDSGRNVFLLKVNYWANL